MSNPLNDAMDAAESEEETSEEKSKNEFDTDEYLNKLGEGPKEQTVGFSVDEPMHRFYKELQSDDNIKFNVAESFREHLKKLARRHPETFERAMRKWEIDREY